MTAQKLFPMLDMTLGDIKTQLKNLTELVSELCNDAFKNRNDIQGAINWADLECVEASLCINADGVVEYYVLVEEAAPDAMELRDFIVDGLQKLGFDIARLTVDMTW